MLVVRFKCGVGMEQLAIHEYVHESERVVQSFLLTNIRRVLACKGFARKFRYVSVVVDFDKVGYFFTDGVEVRKIIFASFRVRKKRFHELKQIIHIIFARP